MKLYGRYGGGGGGGGGGDKKTFDFSILVTITVFLTYSASGEAIWALRAHIIYIFIFYRRGDRSSPSGESI